MAYTDGFVDPGTFDDPFVTTDQTPPPALESEAYAAPAEPMVDVSEDARDERLWQSPMDTGPITEFEPGGSAPPSNDIMARLRWQQNNMTPEPLNRNPRPPEKSGFGQLGDLYKGVSDFVYEMSPMTQGSRSMDAMKEAAQYPEGSTEYEEANQRASDAMMNVGFGTMKNVGGNIGKNVAKNIAKKFTTDGAKLLDDKGRLIANMADEAAAARVAEQMNNAPTATAREATETAARAGGEQTMIPGVDSTPPGRFNEFEVPRSGGLPDEVDAEQLSARIGVKNPAQASVSDDLARQVAEREAAAAPGIADNMGERIGLFDDVGQPTLAQADVGPGAGPNSVWVNSRNPAVKEAADEAASTAATFNARGGIAGMAASDAPPVSGGISGAMRRLDEMEAEAATALGKNNDYAEQLLTEAEGMRKAVGRFTSLIEENVGAPVSREGVEGLAEFTDSARVAGGGGAVQLGFDVFDPNRNLGSILQDVSRSAGHVAGEVVPAMRAAMSTLDISLALRQGIIPAIAHGPEWNKAMDAAAKALWSDEGYRIAEKAWRAFDSFSMAKAAGVAEMAIDNAAKSQKMELFQSSLVEHIPVFGKLTQGSSRHAAAFSNSARFSIFDTYAKSWGIADMQGVNPQKAERMAKDLASFVNSITGVGDLGALDKAAPVLNQLFFAPKFFASRINNLFAPFVFGLQATLPAGASRAQGVLHGGAGGAAAGALAGAAVDDEDRMRGAVKGAMGGAVLGGGIGSRAKAGGSWEMAGLAWRDMSAYYATMGTIAALAVAAGAKVGLDPEATDFMKITVGNHHIDMTGGYSNIARTAFQLVTGEKKTSSGKTIALREKNVAQQGAAEVAVGFGRSLLSPAASSVVDVAFFGNRDIAGNPLGVTGHVPLPMGLSDLWGAVADDLSENPEGFGVTGLGVGVMGMLGVGNQTYKAGEKKPDVSDNPVDLWLADMTGIGKPAKKKGANYN